MRIPRPSIPAMTSPAFLWSSSMNTNDRAASLIACVTSGSSVLPPNDVRVPEPLMTFLTPSFS